MPRTTLTAQTLLGDYPVTPLTALSADFTFAALDNANGNDVVHTGRQLLIFRNDDASPQTVTITSVVDDMNRLGTITTYSITNALYSILGPFPVRGWRQSDGMLYIDCSDADIKCAVITLPAVT